MKDSLNSLEIDGRKLAPSNKIGIINNITVVKTESPNVGAIAIDNKHSIPQSYRETDDTGINGF